MPQRELHQLNLAEHENLKLARDRFEGQNLGRAEMAGSSIVYQNIEVTSFCERGVERLFDRKSIGEVETNRMQSRHFWDALQIARGPPDLVPMLDQCFRNRETDARARTGDKNSFHYLEKGFAPRKAFRVATALIPILTIASMQECPAQQSHYSASRVKSSLGFKFSILSQCCR